MSRRGDEARGPKLSKFDGFAVRQLGGIHSERLLGDIHFGSPVTTAQKQKKRDQRSAFFIC